jgi:hypothetical protein
MAERPARDGSAARSCGPARFLALATGTGNGHWQQALATDMRMEKQLSLNRLIHPWSAPREICIVIGLLCNRISHRGRLVKGCTYGMALLAWIGRLDGAGGSIGSKSGDVVSPCHAPMHAWESTLSLALRRGHIRRGATCAPELGAARACGPHLRFGCVESGLGSSDACAVGIECCKQSRASLLTPSPPRPARWI